MDTKFSVACHILAMISESADVLSSQDLARSVGTNPSYIRKVIALLKNAGLIQSQQGKTGYQLTRATSDISLLAIYLATQEVDHIQLFQTHQNPNEACPVGRHIEGAIRPIFSSVEADLQERLEKESLQDVIDNLYHERQKASS